MESSELGEGCTGWRSSDIKLGCRDFRRGRQQKRFARALACDQCGRNAHENQRRDVTQIGCRTRLNLSTRVAHIHITVDPLTGHVHHGT